MSEDDIRKPLTEQQRQQLKVLADMPDSEIDFTDIPELTDEQLSGMTRFRDRKPKVAVSLRLDATVLEWLKSKGEGHLTRINNILTNVMEAEQRMAQK